MRKSVLTFLALPLIVAACGSKPVSTTVAPPPPPPPSKLSVVATTPVLADFARTIGGGYITVYTVVRPGVDPHDYEPTPADITALSTADVILKNGVGLEKWFDRTMQNAEAKGSVVDTSNGVTLRKGANANETGSDPHIWHSPVNARIMVSNISQALQSKDPAHAQDYQATERGYQAQIDALDHYISQALSALDNKNIVTNHDAFGYYMDEYGLNYVGSVIPSFDTQAELSSAQITDIVAKIKSQNVKAVFSESSVPPKTAETIAREANVKVVEGDDALYGDTLAPEGSDAATYIGMERHNTDVIVANLR